MVSKEFLTLPLSEIVPYGNNPRNNEEAVEDVIASIEQTENLDQIEIDENNVILSGHTRLKALERLGYDETEVVRYSGLTEDQKRKYRLLANKTAEKASWDFGKLEMELDGLDFKGFDFGFNSVLNNSDDDYIDSFFDEPAEEWQEEERKEKLTITVQVETIQDKDNVRAWLDKQGYNYKIT